MSAAPVVGLDLGRMRRDRHARLVDALRGHGLDALVLLGQSNVAYATGARVPAADVGRASLRRAVAVITADGEAPHLVTAFPDGAPPELPPAHLHAPGAVLDVLPTGRLAIDEYALPLRAALGDRELADAGPVLGAAKAIKTPDEQECIRRAQAINEEAMLGVEEMLAPGIRATDLSGRFLRRIFELGATANTVDPIFQVMPRSIADGPYSVTGDVVFPTVTTDRVLAEGDVVWVDTGISYEGYQSDFGRTWIVGGKVSERQRGQFHRWREIADRVLGVTRPGATAADLTRAAGDDGGRRPWLAHLYLAHGCGTDSAEMPFVGTDLGVDFDGTVVLAPGTVVVLEPVVWDDGHAGYRAEEIVAVTDGGYRMLTDHHYRPYE